MEFEMLLLKSLNQINSKVKIKQMEFQLTIKTSNGYS